MVTTDELKPLRTAAPDYEKAELLKSRFASLRTQRIPFFLTSDELDVVFHWKLLNQHGRGAELRARNPSSVYETVTRACFEIRCDNPLYEAKVRLGLLTAIPGIGVPVASAILALVDPEHYCVIDFRGWRAVFGEDRRSFSISDYLKYRREVETVAHHLGWCVQETDLALWELDRRRNTSSTNGEEKVDCPPFPLPRPPPMRC